MSKRYDNEVAHLHRFISVLDKDTILRLKIDIQRLNLDFRRFKLTIRGLKSLVDNPSESSNSIADVFELIFKVTSEYPWSSIPDIRFNEPIPFHPHIWKDGSICWGDETPQPDLMLADWVRGVIEFLQYNQDRGSFFRINESSPANNEALEWWQSNKRWLSDYIPQIQTARLRSLIERTRG